VHQLEIKVLNIIDARCNHEVFWGVFAESLFQVLFSYVLYCRFVILVLFFSLTFRLPYIMMLIRSYGAIHGE